MRGPKIDPRGLRVYLSGPMAGMEDENRPAFAAAASLLRRRGAEVFDPANQAWGDEHPREWYLARDLHELTRMEMRGGPLWAPEPYYDVVAALPGWSGSEGAFLEREVARACGIRHADLADLLGGDRG